MHFQGVIKKMISEFDNPIRYYLDFPNDILCMNQLLDKKINIEYIGYQCLLCSEDKEIYRQGFCKKCFFEAPQAADWIIKPELSKAHLNIEERDLDYEKKIQLQPHIVYLANTGNIKVGVTRKNQTPYRWIDQGAHEAVEILEVPNRYLAGIAEVAIKKYISDKTNWRKMLINENSTENILNYKIQAKNYLPNHLLHYFITKDKMTEINFPILESPSKPESMKLNNKKNITGILRGIKGQYLIFNENKVLNIRAHEGYVIKIFV